MPGNKRREVKFHKKDGKTTPIKAPVGGKRRGGGARKTRLPRVLTKAEVDELKEDPQLQAERNIFIDDLDRPFRLRKRGNYIQAVWLDGSPAAYINLKTGRFVGDTLTSEILERAYEEFHGNAPREALSSKRLRGGGDTGTCAFCGRGGAPWQPKAGAYVHYGCIEDLM
ncbi:MAG: hypothetical protein WHS82_00830 [Candidatus Methanosuratincola sp.]